MNSTFLRAISPYQSANFNRALVAFGLVLASFASAQTRPIPSAKNKPERVVTPMHSAEEGMVLQLSVYNENHVLLDRQAVIKLTNRATQNVVWQTTQDKALATFTSLKGAEYDIEVSAAGFVTAHQQISIPAGGFNQPLEITLQADASAVEATAPHQQVLPSKVRKNLSRGVQALEGGQLTEAEKRLDLAYKEAPSNAEVNFLLGSLYFRKNDYDRAAAYLGASSKSDPQNVQTLTLLGRAELKSKNYEQARGALEHAVQVDPENWLAHNLLAEAYMKQDQPAKAKEQAQLGIEKSHGGGYAATLLLAEADTRLGQTDAAIDALQSYLQRDSLNPASSDVRDLLTHLKRQTASPDSASPDLTSVIAEMDRLVSIASPTQSLQTWRPIGVDESQPPVATGINCPVDTVIEHAGERVKELVDGLARFDAIESMLHEDLDEFGVPKNKTSLKFDYIASISEKKPGVLLVDEYRTWKSRAEDFPDHIATRGLPALAFVFHPELRDNFEMKCEGLGSWNGAATWLIHFKQREDKPHHTQEYVVNGHVFPVSIKGRAWITADTFQIMRLESDLVRPIPEIQLYSQHWSVDYGPVRFSKQNEELWLPKSADLYFDFLKHRYFRRHSYDHFMLFSVDTEEKRKEPTVPDPDIETQHKPRGFGTIVISEANPAWLLSTQ